MCFTIFYRALFDVCLYICSVEYSLDIVFSYMYMVTFSWLYGFGCCSQSLVLTNDVWLSRAENMHANRFIMLYMCY